MSERPPIRHVAILRCRRTGPLRVVSHVDLNRAIERAVRRSGLPVRYAQGSGGGHQIGYAHALPTGAAGERELCQIELEEPLPADEVHRALVAELPENLRPVETEVVSGEKRKHISGSIVAEYEIELSPPEHLDLDTLKQAAHNVLDAGDLAVVRETKSRTRTIDIRPGIHELTVLEPRPGVDEDCPGPRLRMKLALQQEQLVKPAEVVECLERQLERLTDQDVRLNVRVVTRLDLQ